MIRTFTFTLILLFNSALAYGGSSISSQDVEAARRLVQKFQQVPARHMFCSETRMESADAPEVILPQITHFLSQELLKFFAWIQCEQPGQPKPLKNDNSYRWDFRYGLSITASNDYESHINNLRVQTGQIQANKSIRVKVVFNSDVVGDIPLYTIYTLIRENGEWKIDDIALKGYSTEMEEILPGSKSLKTEFQAAYKRAEAACLKDPKCRMKIGS